ncbi:MAG TPA: response regulator [Thermodesulfovibrionia bacterium]|nr:response regulator [Thermodesulfovibrionia bacterium]
MLAEKGHAVEVSCHKEEIILTINKRTLRLENLENELKKIVSAIPEVKAVRTKVGAGYYKADVYRQFDYEKPSKVLLVDDERDFVQTLSKRLQMREMGSAFVYDGNEALELLKEEEPDVMVVDLKMPGIDGMEILRRVKQESPLTEVIILTGHGSKQDEQKAKELGVFAYLNKPVDIAVLTKYMQEAQKKVNEAKKNMA